MISEYNVSDRKNSGGRRPDVFLLIFLSHLDVPSIWLQLVGGDLPQDLLVNWEEHLQTTLFYVIIPAGETVSWLLAQWNKNTGEQSESTDILLGCEPISNLFSSPEEVYLNLHHHIYSNTQGVFSKHPDSAHGMNEFLNNIQINEASNHWSNRWLNKPANAQIPQMGQLH